MLLEKSHYLSKINVLIKNRLDELHDELNALVFLREVVDLIENNDQESLKELLEIVNKQKDKKVNNVIKILNPTLD
ncbi:hypothetical protein LJC10_04860 [Selenomonadales bacterium OttesenSCG-928-I06]|nr:hypothetical protein [Selenomonadales bacterium OttesenSCG-928-I06]